MPCVLITVYFPYLNNSVHSVLMFLLLSKFKLLSNKKTNLSLILLGNIMTKVLNLYNTFTKSLNAVELSGKLITPYSDKTNFINGSFYICGPTVYSDSHIGHAITYIRSDLFRRFMKSIFNVRLHTVMNITDIDDKILEKTFAEIGSSHTNGPHTKDPASHPFNQISDKYYRSFLSDMESVKIQPADLYVKVSNHIHLITNFIKKLENDGHAYVTPYGDVCFRVNSLNNYVGRFDKRQERVNQASGDSDPRDFVLWKAPKPNEPVWFYKSDTTGRSLPGRPGWHVQCSAIASALFGSKLDFHFGGKDLIFPHHYNEEACCCAYHHLDTSKCLHIWASHWLHSGHLILKDRKMSKSLGNVVPIKNFINRSSVNALRLLCIQAHYRSDLEFDDDLINRLKLIDHKISAFVSFITAQLRKIQENLPPFEHNSCGEDNLDIEHEILETQKSIIDGVCNDFHLDKGLESILHLSKVIYAKDTEQLRTRDLIACWYLMKDWCETCGLDYGLLSDAASNDTTLWQVLLDFRLNIRTLALQELRKSSTADATDNAFFNKLLKECDDVRSRVDELGFVTRDPKSS